MDITQQKSTTQANQATQARPAYANARQSLMTLSLGALGVVYGDIGTSPLYALNACFFGTYPVSVNPHDVLGVLSLIFWSLIIVVSIKYVSFILRADNRGEGGILALLALLEPWRMSTGTRRTMLTFLGIFGAALLYGDGMITPAISVLSAIEGLKVATPSLAHYVIPLTILVLFILFVFQRQGTGKVGAIFGPVMMLWFVTLAWLGIVGIARNPNVLAAVSPEYALSFLTHSGLSGFLVLGGVFLVVTGAEALYADMGHFGRKPIRLAWFALVLPSLVLNYFGQGAVLLYHPEEAHHPFFNLVPFWGVYPMVLFSTVVTVIASQAVISGAFSLTRQAVLLGYAPRLNIVQTSPGEIGQIYIPSINWVLMLTTIALVLGFRSSTNLTAAYGMSVSATMVITTGLAFFAMWKKWQWNPMVTGTIIGAFLIIDLTFLGANLFKFVQGGWLPLLVGFAALLIMTTWYTGRELLLNQVKERSSSLDLILANIKQHGITRVPGSGVFLTGPGPGAPGALLHHLKLNQVLHDTVIILTVITEDVPRVPAINRLDLSNLGAGFYRVLVHYGFMQTPNIPVVIRMCSERNLVENLNPENTAYYLGRATLVPTDRKSRMNLWRKRFFAFMSRNSQHAGDYYQLPPGRAVEIGAQIEI